MTIYSFAAELEKSGESGALCTIIRSRGSTPRHQGSKMLVYADGRFTGTVGGGEVESRIMTEALLAIQDGQSRVLTYDMVNPEEGDAGVCGGTVEVLIEPIIPRPMVLVVGGGHVGKAVAHLAGWLNFRVAVSDDRPGFCTPEANPDAELFLPVTMAEIPQQLTITEQTYIVLTTRGVSVDTAGLPALLATPAAYVGVIGSRRRWALTRKSLLESGVPEALLERVVSPIGLELKAETPEEIAVSIMAEILMLRNGGTGQPMKAAASSHHP